MGGFITFLIGLLLFAGVVAMLVFFGVWFAAKIRKFWDKQFPEDHRRY